MAPHSSTLAWKIPWAEEPGRVYGVAKSWTQLKDFTFTFHVPVLEKEVATHSSVLAWRIPGMGEPGGLPSVGLHRVRHDWSDLAAAAAAAVGCYVAYQAYSYCLPLWLQSFDILILWEVCIYFPVHTNITNFVFSYLRSVPVKPHRLCSPDWRKYLCMFLFYDWCENAGCQVREKVMLKLFLFLSMRVKVFVSCSVMFNSLQPHEL